MANFTSYSNYDANTSPFQSIVFGSQTPLLEVELNEMQLIQYERTRTILKDLFGEGVSSENFFTFSSGTLTLNGTMTLNGHLIKCDNVQETGLGNGSVYVDLTYSVATKDSTIRKNGYADGSIVPNTIEDNRYNFETTKRMILEFSITQTQGANSVLVGTITSGVFTSVLPCVNVHSLKDLLINHITNTSNIHQVTATQVGLGNVNNTSDANKPISNATQTALNSKADLVGGVIPSSQLPSFVDDVLEGTWISTTVFNNTGGTAYTPESGKIYVDTSTGNANSGKTFRWSGSAYAVVSDTIALGETSSTAYRGDRGKVAYEHSQATGNAHNMTKADLGLSKVENTADSEKNVANADTLDGLHHSSFAKVGDIGTNDLNILLTPGIYRGSGLVNSPNTSVWWYVLVEGHSDPNWCKQTVTAYGDTGTYGAGDTYMRLKVNNVWTEWEKVYNGFNFNPQGIGSTALLHTNKISDCNLAVSTGFYYAHDSSINVPSGCRDGALLVFATDTPWIQQIFFEWSNGQPWGKTYRRQQTSGVWQAWYQIWDSVNDGANSGLDADLLDGKHSSAFVSSELKDFATSDEGTSRWAKLCRITMRNAYTSTYVKLQLKNRHQEGILDFYSALGATYSDIGYQVARLLKTSPLAYNSENLRIGMKIDTTNGVAYWDVWVQTQIWSNSSYQLITSDIKYGNEITFYDSVYLANAPSTSDGYDSMLTVDDNLYQGDNLVWHAGNDGSDSGLDADKLDGIHASGFAQSKDISTSDLNNLYTSGFYRGYDLANSPAMGVWWYVTVESHADSSWCKQTITSYGGNANSLYDVGYVATRQKAENAWTPWKIVWNEVSLNPQGIGGYLNGFKATDANNATKTGFYLLSQGALNVPTAYGDYTLIVNSMYDSCTWIQQMAFDSLSSKTYRRCKIDNNWQPWYQIWDSANDGSGSGLDADKLDGMEASAFAQKPIIYNATIGTTWTGTSAPYTQEVTVTGLLAADIAPEVDIVLTGTLVEQQEQEKAWGYVSKIVASDNKITVTCNKTKPTVVMSIQIKVVR